MSSKVKRGRTHDMEDFQQPKKQGKSIEPIEPKTDAQRKYISAIKAFPMILTTGPAGTGKTWLAGALAAQALENHLIERIILTRPAKEIGDSMGYLPGELDEKFEPYFRPFRDVLDERLGPSHVDYLIKNKTIEAIPLAYIRGLTFKHCWVILDEAQNTTPKEMQAFLTRVGENCKVIVNGDITQMDIQGESGLTDAIARLGFIPSIKTIRFERNDVVRSGLCQEIVQAYEQRVFPMGG